MRSEGLHDGQNTLYNPSHKWSNEDLGGKPNHSSVQYNDQSLHITANTYNSPEYIRVKWP